MARTKLTRVVGTSPLVTIDWYPNPANIFDWEQNQTDTTQTDIQYLEDGTLTVVTVTESAATVTSTFPNI